jgi:hypothetical protein
MSYDAEWNASPRKGLPEGLGSRARVPLSVRRAWQLDRTEDSYRGQDWRAFEPGVGASARVDVLLKMSEEISGDGYAAECAAQTAQDLEATVMGPRPCVPHQAPASLATSRSKPASRSRAACTAGQPFSCVVLALLNACSAIRLISWRSVRISISR